MRRALCLAALCLAGPAAAQVGPIPDVGEALRLENQQRYLETRQRALQADIGRLQTQQTLQRLERGRQPDPTLARRQAELDAVEAEALLRASQAQSTARAARLRTGLAAFGYADSLPLAPLRAEPPR